VDPNFRTTLVKAEIPNPDHRLKPGMFANLDLTVNIRENSIVVPEVALSQLLDGERAVVFVVDTNSTVQPRPVRLGLRLAGQVEVVSGLEAGETVVVEGVQKIGAGAKVKLAPAEAARPYAGS
ncbi:MAG: efflux RND transporter periplasmic adaptor subunit, partial [Verrucomicrobia bacterium]